MMRSPMRYGSLLAVLAVFAGMVEVRRGYWWMADDAPSEAMVFHAVASGDVDQVARYASPDTVNDRDQSGLTPLCYAALYGNLKNVNQLIGCGADVNAVTPLGYTPLMFATLGDHAAVCEALLFAGADPSLASLGSGATALDMAIENQAWASVRLLEATIAENE